MKLDRKNIGRHLSDGWVRYTKFFGIPPRGTLNQMMALIELSSPDKWFKPRCKGKGCSGENCDGGREAK